jgi:hypothetical protein
MATDICKKDDYSNTIIYKITCKDPNIKDIYVGHTINFVQRKHSHKQNCVNTKSPNYKCKLYETIRSNGGWSNWKMEIIHFFSCGGLNEAKQIEQEYFTLLNANLNSVEPCGKGKSKNKAKKEKPMPNISVSENINNSFQTDCDSKFYCKICNFNCNKKGDLNRHNLTLKHKALTNNNYQVNLPKTFSCACGNKYKHLSSLCAHKKQCIQSKLNTQNIQKILSDKYYCEKCDYETNRKNNMTTHLSSDKHQKLTTYNIKTSDNNENPETLSKYCCPSCNKNFNDRAGLWRHKKKCINVNNKLDEQSLVLEILKQNQEYQKLLLLQQQQILELTAKSFGNILNN